MASDLSALIAYDPFSRGKNNRIFDGWRPRQGNLRLVFRLFSLMRGLPSVRLNNLETSLRFPGRGLDSIVDYFSHPLYFLNRISIEFFISS